MSAWWLAGATFLAAAVEAVEALTVVLAVGVAYSWRTALRATWWACAALVALVVALAPVLRAIPLAAFELVVGTFLTLFGLAWLRKAILRAAGRKAQRDEDAAYAAGIRHVRSAPPAAAEHVAFATAFQAVLLEGLEVVVIVLTFGAASATALAMSSAAAVAAVLVVALAGIALRRPASRVPENAMKFAVGIMLTSFGTYWAGEGLGIAWWGADFSIVVLVACYVALSGVLVAAARR